MPFAILTSIIDAALCFAVSTILLVRGRRQSWDLVLLLYGITLWTSIPWMIYFFAANNEIQFIQYVYDLVVFIPVLLVLFALKTMGKPFSHPVLKVSVALSILFAAGHRHPLFMQGFHSTPLGILPIPGPLFSAFTAYHGLTAAYMIWAVWQAYRRADSWRKTRLQWIGMAVIFADLSVMLHFYSLYTANAPFPHDLLMIMSVLIFGYGLINRRLYNIQLMTREAARTGITVLLSAAPLILGRVFAPIVEDLPSQSRLAATLTLFATLTFFSIGITLVRYVDHRSTRQLARFFLLAALVNAMFFIWAVPKNTFTVAVVRLSYLVGGLSIFAWVDYRRSALEEPMSPAPLYLNLWRWITLIMILVAASTTWVMDYLEYYQTTLRPFAVSPGPLHNAMHVWMYVTPVMICGWIEWRLLKASRYVFRGPAALLILSMVLGGAAAGAFTAFGLGMISWPLPMALEMGAAAGILAHFLRQPFGGRRPSSTLLLSVFLSTLLSCLSGLLLYYGLWMQLVACLLLAFSMPKILNEFQGSARALVDQYLFRSRFSYLAEIERISEDLFQGTHLPILLARLANDLTQRTGLVWTGIWLFDLSEGRFLLRQAAGDQNTQLSPTEAYTFSFSPHDRLIGLLKKEKGLLMTAELRLMAEDQRLSPETVEAHALSALTRLEVGAAFPLFMESKFIGFLGFGDRVGESGFHEGDRRTLSELGRKAEHAIGQSYMLYEQSLMFSKLAQDTLDFLQAMGLNIDILRNQFLGPLNDKQMKQLDIAAQQKEFIRSTLTDLRELERLMVLRMQGAWDMSPYNLKEILQRSIDACSPRLTLQNVALSVDLQDIPELTGDAQSIHRAMDNLLSHAFTLAPAHETVELQLRCEKETVRLKVTAGGAGVDPEDLERLFDPFYKGRPGTPLAYGTGLGLSVVKEVVTLHLGKVWAQSDPGQGTCFIVELPLA